MDEGFTVKMNGVDYHIPERMMYGIRRYVEKRVRPGDFLVAIIENNLTEAVGRADHENMQLLPAYVFYFYNHTPNSCWGSPKIMKNWLKGA